LVLGLRSNEKDLSYRRHEGRGGRSGFDGFAYREGGTTIIPDIEQGWSIPEVKLKGKRKKIRFQLENLEGD